MATILDKIADIENEMARTQKNKATAGHLGMLKAKLAKLRRELITPKSQGGATEQGFEVAKVLFYDLLANSRAIIFNCFSSLDWRCPCWICRVSVCWKINSTFQFGWSLF